MLSPSSLKIVPCVHKGTVYDTSCGDGENRVRSTAKTEMSVFEAAGGWAVGAAPVGVS